MKVVIVGAGPAGLITALNLIQRGITPLILEKDPVIRSTACAEACDFQSLDKVPFNSNPYICRRVKGVKLIFPSGASGHFDKEAVVLDRTSWLRGMAKEVETKGAEIRLNSDVIAIEENSVRLRSSEEIGYHILIGADGPNSRIARYLGVKHKTLIASQYKLAFDTSSMDYLETYFDKRFSPGYSWIFPKDGVINIGVAGDFAHLDAFLGYKGLDDCKIMEREAGIIPYSGIKKLVKQNIALIGDSASMPNPASLGGLTPIIHASQVLASNIDSLEDYEREVKNHPLADPVLVKAGRALAELNNEDLMNLGKLLAGVQQAGLSFSSAIKAAKHNLSLLPKINKLRTIYKAGRIALDYGW